MCAELDTSLSSTKRPHNKNLQNKIIIFCLITKVNNVFFNRFYLIEAIKYSNRRLKYSIKISAKRSVVIDKQLIDHFAGIDRYPFLFYSLTCLLRNEIETCYVLKYLRKVIQNPTFITLQRILII